MLIPVTKNISLVLRRALGWRLVLRLFEGAHCRQLHQQVFNALAYNQPECCSPPILMSSMRSLCIIFKIMQSHGTKNLYE